MSPMWVHLASAGMTLIGAGLAGFGAYRLNRATARIERILKEQQHEKETETHTAAQD